MRRFLLILATGLVFVLQTQYQFLEGQTLKGKITDTSNEPLHGASVSLTGTFKGTLTEEDGTFELTGLKRGSCQVKFSFIGYEPMIYNLFIKNDTSVSVYLKPVSVITDEVIISATRAGFQTPLAYTDVSREIIKGKNLAQDMPYLLSLTPSFIETSESGNGVGYTNMRIRGSDASRINVTIDGIPLNDPESQQVFWVDLPDLASSVDNIQVQRGAGTSSNGSGAFGASINIQTRGIENEPFAEINSSAGSYNTFRNNISVGTGLLKEKFAFQLRYSDLKSDGYVERTGSDHNSAFLSALYRTGRSMLKANLIIGKEHTGIGWWGVPKEMLKVNRRYNPAGEYTDENGITRYYENESDNYAQNHLQLVYSGTISDRLSLHTALHYTRGKGYYEEYKDDDPFGDYGLPPVTIGDTLISRTDLIRRKWMANDFYGMIYSLNFRKEKLEAALGGGVNFYSGDHYGKIIWMRYPGNTEKDYQWYFNTGEKMETNIYAKINSPLFGKISAFGDLQYRHISYDLSGIDDDLKDIGQAHRFDFFNPKAGIFVTFSNSQEAYLSFSVANREPTRTDFKEASGDKNATPKSERLFDTEAGYRIKNPQSSLELNFYSMIYKDQLVPTGELSNVGYPIMTNVARSYRMGIEIIAGIIPLDFVNWNLCLTLSRNKIRDLTEYYTDYNTSDWSSVYKSRYLGNVDIAYSPSFIGTSDIMFIINPSFNIHFISKYVGKQYFDNTMSSERMLDPYFVNSLQLGFEPRTKIIKDLKLDLVINNIFNSMYENNAYGGNWFEDGVEKSWSYYFPQAGINFMVKLGLTF